MILDSLGRNTGVGSADPALAGELGPPTENSMPRGFREDGTSKDHNRFKPSLVDAFRRQNSYSTCK